MNGLDTLRVVAEHGSAPACAHARVVDLTVGVLAVALPDIDAPTFLRLAFPETDTINRARATYLVIADQDLHACASGWPDGPGLAVGPGRTDRDRLSRELFEVGHALRVLGNAHIAASYIELCGIPSNTQQCAPINGDAKDQGGEHECSQYPRPTD